METERKRAIREIPKTMLAWMRPGRLLNMAPMEWIMRHRGKIIKPLMATMQYN